jgi:hypothetical protein
VLRLTQVLDEQGVAAYDQVLANVIANSPAEHVEAWTLMLELSQEPFSYENFNPAVDALERIAPDLTSQCSGLEFFVVDDAGRVTLLK